MNVDVPRLELRDDSCSFWADLSRKTEDNKWNTIPFGDCASLIEDNISSLARSFGDISRLDDNATSSGYTTSDNKNHRHSETKSTRTSNCESGHGICDGIANTRTTTVIENFNPAYNPDHKDKNSNCTHGGYKPTSNLVSQILNLWLRVRSFLHELRNVGDCVLARKARQLNNDSTVTIDSAGDKATALLFHNGESSCQKGLCKLIPETTATTLKLRVATRLSQTIAPVLYLFHQVSSTNSCWLVRQANCLLVETLYIDYTQGWVINKLSALFHRGQDVDKEIPTNDFTKHESSCARHEAENFFPISQGTINIEFSFSHDKIDLGIGNARHAPKDSQQFVCTRGAIHTTDQEADSLEIYSALDVNFFTLRT
ncbi:hypothetical protein HG531_013601 [Fusarium graminearum]|nr:hypothetical protein HG531_013601 [Fusarium graminearum]